MTSLLRNTALSTLSILAFSAGAHAYEMNTYKIDSFKDLKKYHSYGPSSIYSEEGRCDGANFILKGGVSIQKVEGRNGARCVWVPSFGIHADGSRHETVRMSLEIDSDEHCEITFGDIHGNTFAAGFDCIGS